MSHLQGILNSVWDALPSSFPLIRLIYTFFLLALAFILATLFVALGQEVLSTWSQGKIYLSEFSYFDGGAKSPDKAQRIREETVLFYQHVRGLVNKAKNERDTFKQQEEESDDQRRHVVPPQTFIFKNGGGLSELDLSIQGVNVKALLAYFVKLISPASPEVAATIFHEGSERRIYVALPDGLFDNDSVPSPYIIYSADEDTDSAFRLACFLVWSQSTTDEKTNATYDEFCDWARLLRIKSIMSTKDLEELDGPALKADVNYVIKKFQQAITGKHLHSNIISALYGADKYLGGKEIALDADRMATIGATADIIRYIGITNDYDGPTKNWRALLPEKKTVSDPKLFDEIFFKDKFKVDCESGKAQYPNVVRIVFNYKARSGADTPYVLTGILLRDETVVTYIPRTAPTILQSLSSVQGPQHSLKVQRVSCGAVEQSVDVLDSSSLDPKLKYETFWKFRAPNLKVVGAAPVLDYDADSDEDSKYTVAGFIRNMTSIFATLPVPTAIDNTERYLGGTSEVEKMRKIRDFGQTALLDLPFAAGMAGAPVFNDSGKIIGMVTGGIYVNRDYRLRLARSLPISALKKAFPENASRANAPTDAPKKP